MTCITFQLVIATWAITCTTKTSRNHFVIYKIDEGLNALDRHTFHPIESIHGANHFRAKSIVAYLRRSIFKGAAIKAHRCPVHSRTTVQDKWTARSGRAEGDAFSRPVPVFLFFLFHLVSELEVGAVRFETRSDRCTRDYGDKNCATGSVEARTTNESATTCCEHATPTFFYIVARDAITVVSSKILKHFK